MGKIIGLIACSSTKLGKENPAEKYLAQDIYKGHTFILSKEEGLKKYKCEEWHILSGKYGLLDKDERISYYNFYLGKQSAKYKKKWAENVLNKLKSKYDLKNDIFYIFGGKSYYKHLIPHLNCVVFSYKNSNCIDLNKKPNIEMEILMIVKAIELRNKENLQKIRKVPGYYKWWAKRTELDIILTELKVKFDDVKSSIETKSNMFCIYVGIAVKESIRDRLNWHINDKHTESSVKYGTLSTLRQSIASIVVHNQYDKEATDNFIDKLEVEYFFNDNPIKSIDAKNELTDIERRLLQEYLRILNIRDNNHPCAKEIKSELKQLRKIGKNTAIA